MPGHQLCDRRAAGRHDDHDACLPWQFPFHLDFVRRLRAVAETMLPPPTTTAISSNTIPSAPAASSRCAIAERQQDRGGRVITRRPPAREKDDIKRRRRKPANSCRWISSGIAAMGFASTEEATSSRGRAVGQAEARRRRRQRGVGEVGFSPLRGAGKPPSSKSLVPAPDADGWLG